MSDFTLADDEFRLLPTLRTLCSSSEQQGISGDRGRSIGSRRNSVARCIGVDGGGGGGSGSRTTSELFLRVGVLERLPGNFLNMIGESMR